MIGGRAMNKGFIDAENLPNDKVKAYFEKRFKILISLEKWRYFMFEYPGEYPPHRQSPYKGKLLIQKIEKDEK